MRGESAVSMRSGDAAEGIARLSVTECWEFLATQEVGRLALSVSGMPDVFPVNYRIWAGTIVFHTAKGTKLQELTINRYVAFEVDGWSETEAVSVVLRGVATPVEPESEREELRGLALRSWAPGPKTVYVRIRPLSFDGRRFQRGHAEDAR